ncbi:hypothetical protein GJ496_004027 [Pomphorhynchus laevis]|nr:hypothetical protein GJ496_004027 [Pomphorhynchus laevis]
MAGFQIKDPPTDGITKVIFGGNFAQFLLASSWDCKVRLYEVNKNAIRFEYSHDLPVLDCCLLDNVYAFSGGLDCTLKMFDFNSQKELCLGKNHKSAIRCILHSSKLNAILTGSWDSTVRIWDCRDRKISSSMNQSSKVYTMDCVNDRLVVGTSDRKVSIWDLRSTQSPISSKDSSLKFQTRCIKCFPNGQGYILGSIEGRVAVEFFNSTASTNNDSSTACSTITTQKRYAFKCHRGKYKEGDVDLIWPVNCIEFHPIHGTFATGGSDGYVHVWDGINKKRLSQFHQYDTGVTSLAFSPDGIRLAIATSYNFEVGEQTPKPIDGIFIRLVSDSECRPKA